MYKLGVVYFQAYLPLCKVSKEVCVLWQEPVAKSINTTIEGIKRLIPEGGIS
jgi:hypothetical protein